MRLVKMKEKFGKWRKNGWRSVKRNTKLSNLQVCFTIICVLFSDLNQITFLQ